VKKNAGVRERPFDSGSSRFPVRDRYTVSGMTLGDICFACECRVLELRGDENMVLAWCECVWPGDAAEMEVL
jgi:hypothetical protein